MSGKPTEAQRATLAFYERSGPTTQAFGQLSVWRRCVAAGWLSRSHGMGPITTEITEAGRQTLEAKTSSPPSAGQGSEP